MRELVIDPELEALIPPLTDDEYSGLEADIIRDGLRKPIEVWAGHNTIVDGHNRYHICMEHGIPFTTIEKKFSDKLAVIDYMVREQKHRRNLNPGQLATLGIDASEAKYREEARTKKKEDGKKTGGLAHTNHGTEGFRQLAETLSSTENQNSNASDTHIDTGDDEDVAATRISRYQADIPIEVLNDPTEKPAESRASLHTAQRIAKDMDVGVRTVERMMAVKKSGDADLYDKVRSGKLTANAAYKEVVERKKEAETAEVDPGKAIINVGSGTGQFISCDLLITETPHADNPDEFVRGWLFNALSGVRPTGFAYIFVDPDVDTLRAYLNADTPMNVELVQVLTWSFKYLIGYDDKSRYKPDSKHILFYRGIDAPDLSCPFSREFTMVHSVDAEGGDTGKRDYELYMPMTLADRLIRHSTKEGDLVFDPFAKRGTFLLAAKKLGRDSIGYEEDQILVDEAVERGVTRG